MFITFSGTQKEAVCRTYHVEEYIEKIRVCCEGPRLTGEDNEIDGPYIIKYM